MEPITALLVAEALLCAASVSYAARTRRFAGTVERQAAEAEGGEAVSVTVVILAQEQEKDLRRNLPLYIGQSYAGEFAVIVADIRSTDGTSGYLEDMEETYPTLSHTSVPRSAKDISLRRLAMTLGLRAAATEWVVFTDAACTPPSDRWLGSFMSQCKAGNDAVVGMTAGRDVAGWTGRKWQFFRLWQQALWMPRCLNGVPYRADDSLFAYRRSHFMAHGGFGSDSGLLCGAAALLLNKYVARGRCGLSVAPGSILLDRAPSPHGWRQERVYFMETRRHLRHACAYRSMYFLYAVAPLLFAAAAVAVAVLAGRWWQIAVATALWLAAVLVRARAFGALCRRVGVRRYVASFPLLEAMVPLWDAGAWLGWLSMNKNMFRKKFV